MPELSPTLKGNDWQAQVPDVLTPTYAIRTANTGANGCGVSDEAAYTLDGTNSNAVMCLQDGQANGGICDDHAPTLNAMHEQPIVIDRAAYNQGENAAYPPHIEQTEAMDPLVARGPHAVAHRTGRTS